MTNEKFGNSITALNDGKIINKPKDCRFQIGDYLIYNKEMDLYYNLSYAQIKNLFWNSHSIVGYIAKDDMNTDNHDSNKAAMIELSSDNE
jgi:hypothetical protein